ncbi:MAG: cyclic pyranopterin monophosphate synthase MoaC [Bacteroidota bacterium]|jgi:cyclic pyranopterin phosphate synthase
MKNLSHIDENGSATMVDVTGKSISLRTASAEALVLFPQEVFEALLEAHFGTAKGSVVEVAKVAGIQAAKRCSDWIPMCHPLMLSKIEVSIDIHSNPVRIQTLVKCEGKTGVEMEALTAASAAALTIYDMCKALSHEIAITEVRLLSKTGGKSDFNSHG